MSRIARNIIIFLLAFTYCYAEELTTGNLITNGDFETGNANGWTTGGDGRVLEDCCVLNNRTSNYDYEFGDSGYISQEFGLTSNSITTDMLDNGITLNSTIEVQNGECGVQGCWGGTGAADTFTNQLKIKDVTGKTLAEVTQSRTDTTGIAGQDFQDTLIYTDTGSYYGNIRISGTDANAPATLGGPNVDNVTITMTYDDAVMPTAIQAELNTVFEELFFELEEEFNEENFTFKEEEIKFEEEFKFEEKEMTFEEEMIEFFEEPVMMTMKEEEKEEFKEPPMMMEMFEESNEEEEPVMEMVMEVMQNEEKEEKEISEEESNSDPTESANAEESSDQEQKESVRSEKTKTVRLETVLEKIETEVKALDKNLQLTSLVKLSVMAGDNPLDAYNIPFYEPRIIYEDQLNIQDNRVIYMKDLVEYKQNDPIAIKKQQLNIILQERQNLINELEVLRNG
jgi:hypothetical protein